MSTVPGSPIEREVRWREALQRLFRTFFAATRVQHLILALACVAGAYLVGRVLDSVWLGAGGGVYRQSETMTEVVAFARDDATGFRAWRRQQQRSLEQVREALSQYKTDEHRTALAEARQVLENRIQESVNGAHSADDRRLRNRGGDVLRIAMAGKRPELLVTGGPTVAESMTLILGPRRGGEDDPAGLQLREVLAKQIRLPELRDQLPAGPFGALLRYEIQCLSGVVRGVFNLNFSFAEGAYAREPGVVGSLLSGGAGLWWLVSERPFFGIVYGLLLVGIFGLFGGGLCRSAALDATLSQPATIKQALGFSRKKIGAFALAVIIPAGAILLLALVLWIMGLIAAVPLLDVIVSILFPLALLLGLGVTLFFFVLVVCADLMWATIAVDGTDANEGLMHAGSYVVQHPWLTALYTLVLLVYGAVCLAVIRVAAMLVLKFTHLCFGAGMGVVGASGLETVGKLDAIWSMPDLNELSVLPQAGGIPFWGEFAAGPLNWHESLTCFFIMLWVFLIVALVGAFVISFFYCGVVEMYLLLRRAEEGADFSEVYYVEDTPADAPEGAGAVETDDPTAGATEGA